MDYSPHRTLCKRSLVMASLFIVIGLLTFYNQLEGEITWRNWVRVVSGATLLLFGILMLMPRHRNIMSTIGLMCLGIGLSRLVVSLSNVFNPAGFNGFGFTNIDVILIIIGYVTMWFAAYQIYRGVNFLQGNAMNAFIMRFTSMSIVLTYLVAILYATVYFDIPLADVWEIRTDFLTSPILYSMYFVLLCSREAFELMEWERVRTEVLDVAVPLNPGLLRISDDGCRKLMGSYGDFSKWDAVDNGSPVERELRVGVIANNHPMDIVLRKWAGSDLRYLNLVPGNGGAFTVSPCAVLVSVEFEEHSVMLMGEKNPIMVLYPERGSSCGFTNPDDFPEGDGGGASA